MRFDASLYDGSDPAYSPCMKQVRDAYYWRAPLKYVQAGYKLKNVWVGKVGDNNYLDRAAKCRELTREMLRWYEGVQSRLTPGTWGELIARYKTDEYSPIRDVKANTRQSYLDNLAYWEPVISHLTAEHSTFDEFRRIQKAMEKKGRSDHFIHAKFGMLRILAGYGVAVDPAKWGAAKAILGQVKLRTPPERTVFPTREQLMAVVERSDAAGYAGFSLGILMQFFFALRARDVRGDWMPIDGDRSGIVRGKNRWSDGLTWDMIDRDVTELRKVASKTIRTDKRQMTFDLTLVPMIRDRLLQIENRVGPVILDPHGMPYAKKRWSELWAKFRDEAGLPKDICVMDLRAGAATEAEAMGANMRSIQIALNHTQAKTTERYTRGKDAVRNQVIEMRVKK